MKKNGNRTIEDFFEGRPGSLGLFNAVREYIESLGPVKIEVMKTQVSFGARTKFAWVWLPQAITGNRPESSITVTFSADHRIEDEQIAESVEPRPGHWTHHVVVEEESGINEELRGWLRDAYMSHR